MGYFLWNRSFLGDFGDLYGLGVGCVYCGGIVMSEDLCPICEWDVRSKKLDYKLCEPCFDTLVKMILKEILWKYSDEIKQTLGLSDD